MAKIKDRDSKKIKQLIVKVKALAQRGDKGEKENAERKLNELLLKYKITKYEESKYKKRTFKLADFNDCKTIMVHCILDTESKAEINGNSGKKELYCKLTDEQYIDTCEKFNHYYPEFYKQREAFIKAFIVKNDLGIIDGEADLTNEEINDIKDMMDGVVSNPYIKHNQKQLSCAE